MSKEHSHGPVIKAFISYSHRDEEMKLEFEERIKSLNPDIKREVWSDRQLSGGDQVHEEIFKVIAEADVFFALISGYYLASDYCKDEMRQALDQAKRHRCRVVPVMVRKTGGWHKEYGIGNYAAIPKDGKGPSE